MFRKMNKKRDIRRIYRTIEGIHDARSPREADVLTGYAFGIVVEMFTGKRITAVLLTFALTLTSVCVPRSEWVSFRHHIYGSYFCIHSAGLCLWLEHLIYLHLK